MTISIAGTEYRQLKSNASCNKSDCERAKWWSPNLINLVLENDVRSAGCKQTNPPWLVATWSARLSFFPSSGRNDPRASRIFLIPTRIRFSWKASSLSNQSSTNSCINNNCLSFTCIYLGFLLALLHWLYFIFELFIIMAENNDAKTAPSGKLID